MRMTLCALSSAGVFFLVVGVSAQQAVPRTPWGDPDLQGVYTNSSESGIPMERPEAFSGKRLDEVRPEDLARLAAPTKWSTRRASFPLTAGRARTPP